MHLTHTRDHRVKGEKQMEDSQTTEYQVKKKCLKGEVEEEIKNTFPRKQDKI